MYDDPNAGEPRSPNPQQPPQGESWGPPPQGHSPQDFYSGSQYPAYPNPSHGYASAPTKTNGLGIASLVMSIFFGLCLVASIAMAGYLVAERGGRPDPESPAMIATGLLMLGSMGMQFIAFVLGAIALFLPDRGKVCAILGMVFSGMAMAVLVLLMIIGMTVGG